MKIITAVVGQSHITQTKTNNPPPQNLPEIDNAPQAAQDVAFDIRYNPDITSTTWTNFKNYFNNKNIKELAKQVHRIGVSENRNNEMRDKILSIKKW